MLTLFKGGNMSKKVVNVLAKVFQALQEGKKSYREIAEENGVSKGGKWQQRGQQNHEVWTVKNRGK